MPSEKNSSIEHANESPAESTDKDHDVLAAADTGRRVIRGSSIRGAGYVLGTALTAVASLFLLRHLGVVAFGWT